MAGKHEKTPERCMLEAGRDMLHGKLYPNMDEIPELAVGTVLANVEALYLQEQCERPGFKPYSTCYSQVGPVLIALNPFKLLPCTGKAWQDAFRCEGLAGRTATAWKTLGPHCYGTIEEAYQALRHNPLQSVVICGESGAGKTWTNKLMLEYLLDTGAAERTRSRTGTHLSKERMRARTATLCSKTFVAERKKQLEAANSLLEAFGNAKTGRNDNSSRFGKYSQLFFEGEQPMVSGLKIDHYLLERSRLVCVPEGERNYHIIHYLSKEDTSCDSDEDVSAGDGATSLPSMRSQHFKYVGSSAGVSRAGGKDFEDELDFEALKDKMCDAGFSLEAQADIYDTIKGVLYLGNIGFTGAEDACVVDAGSADAMRLACHYLRLEEAALKEALTHKLIKAVGETVEADVGITEAAAQRDTLAKTVYARVFDQIVSVLNSKMGSYEVREQQMQIGLLDVFGFEDMPVNGFEQMFINLTNEWIQNLFNGVMFQRELDVYMEEEISITFERPDNWQCVELFILEKPPGIIKLLQDRCLQSSAKDGKHLVEHTLNRSLKEHPSYVPGDPSLVRNVVKAKQERWKKIKIDVKYEECFQVQHYAGDVLYTAREFLSKSRDSFADHFHDLLEGSKSEFLLGIFRSRADSDLGAKGAKQERTVGQKFRQQLRGLMDTLEKSSTVFVRCIKPNAIMQPGIFDESLVLEQLTNGGVIAALEMRQAGLPDRLDFREFIQEFWPLEVARREEETRDPKTRCHDILAQFVTSPADVDMYRIGIKRVFMRSGVLLTLRQIAGLFRLRCARLIQRKWRAKTGLRLVSRIQQLKRALEGLEEQARANGVDDQPLYLKTFEVACKKVDSTLEKVQRNPEVWDKVLIAQQAIDGKHLEKEVEKACATIPPKVAQQEVTEMCAHVDECHAAVGKLIERRKVVVDRLSALVVLKKQQINELIERVEALERYCEVSDDKGPLQLQCREAKAFLEDLIEDYLPGAMQEALRRAKLSGDDPPEVGLPPQAETKMFTAQNMVTAAEQMGESLLEERKAFEFQVMQRSPELQALIKEREEAKERLELLESDSKEAVNEGLTELAQALSNAWKLDAVVEKECSRVAKNPDNFIEAICGFLAAEQATRDAMARIKQLEREAHDREMSNLRALFGGYERSGDLRRLSTALLELLRDFGGRLDAERVAAPPAGLSTQEGTASHLRERLRAAEGAIEAIGLEAMDHSDGVPSVGGRILFNHAGPWSAEFFKLLGPDVYPYEGLARVLDESRCGSVLDAVEALNAGVMVADCGYCIGWSEAWGQYFFLFQRDKHEAALAALAQTQAELESASRQMRINMFQSAVVDALRSAEHDRSRQALSDRQQEMENRIKERVRAELESAITARAAAEVEREREQAQKEVETVNKKVQFMMQEQEESYEKEKQRIEGDFMRRIASLSAKIKASEQKASGALEEKQELEAEYARRVASLSAKLQASEVKIVDATHEKEDLEAAFQQRVESLSAKIQSWEGKAADAMEEKRELEDDYSRKVASLSAKLQASEHKVEDVFREKEELEEAHRRRVDSLAEKVAASEGKAAEAETERQELEDEHARAVASLSTKLQASEAKVDEVLREKDELGSSYKAKMDALAEKIAASEGKAVEATTERQQLEEEHARALAALSAKLMATELKAADAEQERREIEEEAARKVASLSASLNSTEAKAADAEKERREIEEEAARKFASLAARLNSTEAKAADAEQERREIEEEAARRVASLAAKLHSTEAKVEDFANEKAMLESTLRRRVDSLSAKIAASEGKATSVAEEKRELEREFANRVASLSTKLQASEEKVDEVLHEKEEIEADYVKRIHSLMEKMQASKMQVEDVNREKKGIEDAYMKKVASVSAKMHAADLKIDSVMQERAALEERYREEVEDMLLERSALESKYMNTVASLSRHVLEADAKAEDATVEKATLERRYRERIASMSRHVEESEAKAEDMAKQRSALEGRFVEKVASLSRHVEESEAKAGDLAREREEVEAGYQRKLAAISQQLQVADVLAGRHGDLPRMYLEALELARDCERLRQSLDKASKFVKSEREDINEALAYCEGLQRLPEGLPGLRDLVQTLQKCQTRHENAEKLVVGLGLKGQDACLHDVRARMAGVAVRCAKVCQSRGSSPDGTRADILALSEELHTTRQVLLVLQTGLEAWSWRAQEAANFYGMAQVCCDLRREEYPEVGTYALQVGPRRHQDRWELLVFEVLEALCRRRAAKAKQELRRVLAPDLPPQLHMHKERDVGARPQAQPSNGARAQAHSPPSPSQPPFRQHNLAPSWCGAASVKQRRRGPDFQPGDKVVMVSEPHAHGTVRFVGGTMFAAGDWIGVELDTMDGRNDGSVNGIQYFSCRSRHGLFVRPHAVEKAAVPELDHIAAPTKQRRPHHGHARDHGHPNGGSSW